MSRFVVLHASDLHLDAPFEGIGRTPPHIAAALRDASLAAWDALVASAIAHDVAAVLLAGGLCGGLEHGVRAQARLRDGVARLSAAGIRVFIALGGGDPLEGFAAIPAWPHGVTVFAPGAPQTVPLERIGVRLATIHGVSTDPGAGVAAPRFARSFAPGPHLAVLHAALDGDLTGASCTPCRLADLQTAGIDYWALGHSHALEYRSSAAPWIVYPGTPQGRSLTAAECGAKGAVLIEIADGAIVRVEVEPLDRIRCLRFEISGVPDAASLARQLGARAAELRERNAGRALVLDAQVDGAASVRHALRQPAARAELLRTLRAAAESWEPFVWWAGVRGNAPAARERAAALTVDDLATEVERRRAELAADAVQRTHFMARRGEPLRDAWTADIEARDAGELLDAAAGVAVDALREDPS
jgi:DNA repair exonuclease SbcCD nuclease subunit